MRFHKFTAVQSINGIQIRGGPVYTGLLADGQFTVALDPAVTIVFSPPTFVTAAHTMYGFFRNSSTGAQQIRMGPNPSFSAVPPRGILLMPGDTALVERVSVSFGWEATGNLAGGLLDALVFYD